MREPTEAEIRAAASELASQEFHNPGWCKPGQYVSDGGDLYRSRAYLILKAARAAA